ncbi:MAG TPA: M24 family metallopeptidase, partial [Acidimicrobiales bacterium]|nr:M24 family metallopeptidase [Acidimicrobiales bacterium]
MPGQMVPTVDGRPIPEFPDLARMRRERMARLQEQLSVQGLAGLVLLQPSAVSYASGAHFPAGDSGRAALFRPVVVVVAGDASPHLFTPYPEGAPPDLPADHLHGPAFPDLPTGASALATAVAELVPQGRIAIDEVPYPLRALLGGRELVNATSVMVPVKLRKTVDELACIRHAQRLNELAMCDVMPLLRPGVSQSELTAVFLDRLYELGDVSNGIDPIWQPMPAGVSSGPWTVHGDIAFPTGSTGHVLRYGDVIWCDTGIHWEGYASDFGRTWLIGADPTPRQQSQYRRWQEVTDTVLATVKPGVTALDLTRAAIAVNGGRKPWIEHFYLSHAVGTDSAEMPLIGTDMGDAFDE